MVGELVSHANMDEWLKAMCALPVTFCSHSPVPGLPGTRWQSVLHLTANTTKEV